VTPGEYKLCGEGVTIEYGFHPTPFGECLLAKTERGICALRFLSTTVEAVGASGITRRLARRRVHKTMAMKPSRFADESSAAQLARVAHPFICICAGPISN